MSGLVLSLFPGIGLLDMAFEEEGFCVVRGPDLLWGGDIRRFHPPAGRFDGVIGGPPCQSFSPLVNIRPSLATKAANQNQIPEFERVVHEARPAWFVMENVREAPLPEVCGYMVQDELVNNRWCGGEQNRLRRFSFGWWTPIDHVRRRLPSFHVHGEALEPATWKAAVTSAHGGERRTHFNKGTGGKIQRYTVEEALDAQGLGPGFFDGLPFRRDAALKMLANGVPLAMGRAVARAVREAIGERGAA